MAFLSPPLPVPPLLPSLPPLLPFLKFFCYIDYLIRNTVKYILIIEALVFMPKYTSEENITPLGYEY